MLLNISCTHQLCNHLHLHLSPPSKNCCRKNVLALVKAFISKENIGKYLDDLPDVNYDFKTRKPSKSKVNSNQLGEVGTFVFYLSVATIAVCMVLNLIKATKWNIFDMFPDYWITAHPCSLCAFGSHSVLNLFDANSIMRRKTFTSCRRSPSLTM